MSSGLGRCSEPRRFTIPAYLGTTSRLHIMLISLSAEKERRSMETGADAFLKSLLFHDGGLMMCIPWAMKNYRVPSEPAAGRGTPVPRLSGRRPGAGAAVRRPIPCRRGPQAPLRVTRAGTGFQCLGFWGLTLYGFRVLGFGFSGCTHARDAPMPGIYTLGF